MESDPNFVRLGSMMGPAYTELFIRKFIHTGHYYLYVPHRSTVYTHWPVLFFLHGSGGNFKAYTWILSSLAEKEGMVLIVPSFGFGNWSRSEGINFILEVLDDVSKFVPIDLKSVYLAGLSNGGRGVSRLADNYPDRFKGLIYISPVLEDDVLSKDSFVKHWRHKPVLVITGENDDRIPLAYVQDRISKWHNQGLNAEEIIYKNEDHFLIFSKSKNVNNDISNWLTKIKNSPNF